MLPIEAVAGTAQRGEVSYLARDGSVHLRAIRLGIMDGAVVEIKSGLREGDRVLATAPHLGALP